MDITELLSNNDLVHGCFALSWVCLGLIALLMFYIGEEVSVRNTLLMLLMPVDILVGTGCAYIGSGSLTSNEAKMICIVIAICAAAVIVLGVIWRSTTTVGLAGIGLEFTIISLRLFGGYTAQIMSAFIVLIAFMHGLKKFRETLNKKRISSRKTPRRGRRRTAEEPAYEDEALEEMSDRPVYPYEDQTSRLPVVRADTVDVDSYEYDDEDAEYYYERGAYSNVSGSTVHEYVWEEGRAWRKS